jgi:L-ascorbate metabolism protein UlaG (beta-lactamase superfamily)
MPGEYETAGIIIHGIAARAHMDEEGKNAATIYTLEADGTRVVILGHIYPELSEDQLEQIGMVDIVAVPVGNSGYTLDAVGALKIIKQIEPKVVIPTHYADNDIKYEMPQVELAEALKNLGMEISETLDKYKYKPADLSDSIKLVILNR